MRASRALVAVTLLGGLLPLVGAPQVACASEGPRAVLVVDTGPDAHRYCVALPDESVSGTELIELASDQHGLAYKLGFGGEAVCMLAGVGPTGGDCFEEYPDFWAYWRSDGSGGWTSGSIGAGSTVVGNGDVEGWSWGSGDDPESHPAPPATTFASVCKPAPAPEPNPDPTPTRKPDPPAGGAGAAPKPPREPAAAEGGGGAAPRAKGEDEKRRPRGREDRTAPPTSRPAAVEPSPSPPPRAARPLDPTSSEGPPAAGIAGLAAAVALGAAGAVVARRRISRGGPG
jgi:hypothetical protein